jgi:hypothetical protein
MSPKSSNVARVWRFLTQMTSLGLSRSGWILLDHPELGPMAGSPSRQSFHNATGQRNRRKKTRWGTQNDADHNSTKETSNFQIFSQREVRHYYSDLFRSIQIYSLGSVDGSFRAAMAMRSDLWERNCAFVLWTSSQWQQQKADCRTMWANPEVECVLMLKCKVLKLFDHLVHKGKRDDCWNISETSKIWSSHTILQCTCLACKYSQSIIRDSWTDSVNFPQGLGNFPQEFRGRELGAESSRLCGFVVVFNPLYILWKSETKK